MSVQRAARDHLGHCPLAAVRNLDVVLHGTTWSGEVDVGALREFMGLRADVETNDHMGLLEGLPQRLAH